MAFPPAVELQSLLDHCRPLQVLEQLQGEIPAELVIYKAIALLYIDCEEEAFKLLEPVFGQLQGDALAYAKRYWAQMLLRKNQPDDAIFAAQTAMQAAQSVEMRAHAMTELAHGYGRKGCWQLAEKNLREAKALVGPDEPILLLAETRMKLEMDQRLAARDVYDRLGKCDVPWAKTYADWGRGAVALLLGDFEEARAQLDASFQTSREMVSSYGILIHLALINEDVAELEKILAEVARLSPKADMLPPLQETLARLQKRLATPESRRRRLKAFPTVMQKRNYCGPSTIDLILRFWKSSEAFTDDQIAAYVKFPHGGTPIYRMQEFFHLVGFDTIRCLAPIEKLKQLIDAGYPVIVAEEFPDNAHVSVVIGYDDAEHLIEFQDPVTHQVIALPEELVNRLRKSYLDSAVIAFPHGQGHDKNLARLGFFDEPSIVWTDQAQLAVENGRYQDAAAAMERAVQRLPMHQSSWAMWLSAELESWQRTERPLVIPRFSQAAGARRKEPRAADARRRYLKTLAHATELYPDAKFVHIFAGYGALQDGDAPRALAAFKRASEIDRGDSRNFAMIAECHYALRDVDLALEAAREAVKRNPPSPLANVWMARCLAAKGDATAEHYATCALEQAAGWWLAHQAMAEVHLMKRDHIGARRELDIVLGMDSRQSQARIRRAILAGMDGAREFAVVELEESLKSSRNLPLYAAYNARQMLCRDAFGRKKFARAYLQVRKLLKLTPADPWALQFLAATVSEILIRMKIRFKAAVGLVRRLYAKALTANQLLPAVVADYLRYLASLVSPQEALSEIARLRDEHPEHHGLLVLHARWQYWLGKNQLAAQLMLEAVGLPRAISDADELFGATQIILSGLGAEAGEKALLEIPVAEGAVPMTERQRALGLVFATRPKETGERARALLQGVLATQPQDAYATLRLGDVTPDPHEREELYRRALRLAPGWSFARSHLAEYLIDANHPDEALEFTDGHQNDSVDLLTAHGRALYSLSRYDEAQAAYRTAISQVEQPEPWLYNNLWKCSDRSGDHQTALATARQAIRRYPKEVHWYSLAATSLRNLGRFYESAQAIERGRLFGLKWVVSLDAQYETAWARGDFRQALRIVEKLAKFEKSVTEERFNLSEERRFRLLLSLKRMQQARALFESKKFEKIEDWRMPVWITMQETAWELAGEYAERLLALDAQNFTGMFARAESLRETGQLEQALAALEALRVAHPYEHNSYEKLAVQRAMDGKLDEAMELAERAVLLGPFCAFAWATRGYVYFLRGQWVAARADLETGWRRADFSMRREGFIFWWILAELQNKPILALYRRFKSWREAKVDWHHQERKLVGDHLKQTVRERLRQHPLLTWPGMLATQLRGLFRIPQPEK